MVVTGCERLDSMAHMERRKPSNQRTGTKAGSPRQSIDEYLAGVPEPARTTLQRVRRAIRSALPPDAVETISYRMPAFKYDGRVLMWFAAFSNHCSLFPTASVVEAFEDELKDFHTSKGTIQFPTDKPLPAPLIRKLVKARLMKS